MSYSGVVRVVAMGIFVAALSACGGGGGSAGGSGDTSNGISGTSLEQLRVDYDQKRSDTYHGATQQAELDETNAIAYAHLYFGELPGTAVADTSGAAGASKVGVVTSLSSKTRTRLARKTSDVVKHAGEKITVNESSPCDNVNGVIRFNGSLDDSGVGALALEFSECELDGATFSGSGAFYTDSNGHDEMFFDRVGVNESGAQFYLTGRIAFEYDMPTYFLAVESVSAGETFQFENLAETWRYYLDLKIETSVSGRIYLPESGYVSISGQYRDFHDYSYGQGQVSLQGTGSSQGVMELQPPYANLMLRYTGSENFDVGTVVTLEELTGIDEVTGAYVAADLVNYPPIPPVISFPQDSYSSRDGIQISDFYYGLNKSGFSDGFVDYDGDTVTASCRWSINGEVLNDVSSCMLMPDIAAHQDVVSVVLLLSDGKTEVESNSVSTTIDNTIPPPVIWKFELSRASLSASEFSSISVDAIVYQPVSGVVVTTYHWLVNSFEVQQGYENFYIQQPDEGDVISVYMELEDGFNTVRSTTLSLVVGP